MKQNIFVEIVTDGYGDFVFSSIVEKADDTEINMVKSNFERTGKCTCSSKRKLIYDVPGWMYDERYCAICGSFVGLI